MRRFQLSLFISVLGLAACGSDDSGEDPAAAVNDPAAMTYTLFDARSALIPAQAELEAGPFTLPVAGTVTYKITDLSPTTSHQWDISIIPASELHLFEARQNYGAYAPHAKVSTQSDSAPVPAGTYTIGIVCRNASEDCRFMLDATMIY